MLITIYRRCGARADGELNQNALRRLGDRLSEAFPESRITLDHQAIHPPSSCLNRSRGQYNSTLILQFLRNSVKKGEDERILAVEVIQAWLCRSYRIGVL